MQSMKVNKTFDFLIQLHDLLKSFGILIYFSFTNSLKPIIILSSCTPLKLNPILPLIITASTLHVPQSFHAINAAQNQFKILIVFRKHPNQIISTPIKTPVK